MIYHMAVHRRGILNMLPLKHKPESAGENGSRSKDKVPPIDCRRKTSRKNGNLPAVCPAKWKQRNAGGNDARLGN